MTITMKVAGAVALMIAVYALFSDDRCPSENIKSIQVGGILVAGCRETMR